MMTREERGSLASQQNGASGDGNRDRLAKGLGWFSIGLGAAELLMPGGLAELIGVKNVRRNRRLLRSYGLREMVAGVGILSQAQPAGWMWGRVAGDLVDLASLGSAFTSSQSDRLRLATAVAAVAGVTALDVFCGNQLTSGGTPSRRGRSGQVSYSILINRQPEEIYRYWRELSNLPCFMSWIESVELTGERRSHWKAKIPGDMTLEWDAELIDDQPNELIAWRSLDGSRVRMAGKIRFERAPAGRGTVVRQQLQYEPPGGAIGEKIASLFGKMPLRTILENDLRRLKQLIETGEVIESDASIYPGLHPAQPPSREEAKRVALRCTLQPSTART